MKILDLFCGAGGAAVGLHRAFPDAEIVGVDIRPQPRYPFTFVLGDALEFDLTGFDFVWASPPCQAYTAYRRRPDHVAPAPELIAAMRQKLLPWGGPWIIENVYSAPLNALVVLCGSMFGLDVRRHRYFESSLPLLGPACCHDHQLPRFAQATNRANLRKTVEIGVWRIPLAVQQRAMGINWMASLNSSSVVYCSRQCVQAVRSEAARQANADPPATVEPRRDRWIALCALCGREQAEYLMLPTEARDRARAGLPRCTTCGGWVELQVLFSYAVGNPPGYKPMRKALVLA